MKKKLFLISYNTKIGMKLIHDCYRSILENYFDLFSLTDVEYSKKSLSEQGTAQNVYGISNSNSHLKMALDNVSPRVLFKIFSLLLEVRPDVIYFVSSHPLNVITSGFARLFNVVGLSNILVVSHIHDVKPHSRTKNYFFIDFCQRCQVMLSHKVSVYGEFLKQDAIKHFSLDSSQLFSYVHGVNRNIGREECTQKEKKRYVSLIGRIDSYKGIDTFIELAQQLELILECEFLIAGAGDLSAYSEQIKKANNLVVINRFLSDDEIDEMLLQSYALILPYKDASQSGMTPVAYYNACPVIVSDVGGLPETVDHGITGYIYESSDFNALVDVTCRLVENQQLQRYISGNCFTYYREKLAWKEILDKVAAQLAPEN